MLVETYGLVVVAAAGNDAGSHTVHSPGTAKYVITAGAAHDPSSITTDLWTHWSYSSQGPCDDGRIKPDILAPGVSITGARYGTSNLYTTDSGTSAACAFVAGLVALWLDKDYSLRFPPNDYHPHPRVKKLLMASATDMPRDYDPGLDNIHGAGRVDAQDEVNFYETDISASRDTAPLVLRFYQHEYNRYNEPLWVEDPSSGADWYKIKCYQNLIISVEADGDPDLILRIQLYDYNGVFIKQSSAGNWKFLSHTATYQGRYYVRILVQQYTGDYYDITIATIPS